MGRVRDQLRHRAVITRRRVHDEMVQLLVKRQPNLKGAFHYPAGHFYSPLVDIASLSDSATGVPYDGSAMWEHVDLRHDDQVAHYRDLLENHRLLPFPEHGDPDFRYHWNNGFFPLGDAFALSGLIQRERPRRIVEVGSGFSSAAMLDTLDAIGHEAELTFVEPYPERLRSLLRGAERSSAVLEQPVQEVPVELFDQLEDGDVLFIDSSHVLKPGSDVAFLLLRVLPRLRAGVFVHVHDIAYPDALPMSWIRDGVCWNESLALRVALLGDSPFRIVSFNAYAEATFPELFDERLPLFRVESGGSLWLRKVR